MSVKLDLRYVKIIDRQILLISEYEKDNYFEKIF